MAIRETGPKGPAFPLRKKPKHELPVIDEALRQMGRDHKLTDRKEIVIAVAKARRFMFTDDASARLGQIIEQIDDLLMEHHQFAIPPFPTCYVELNLDRLYEETTRPTSAEYYGEETADHQIGFLFDRGKIWTFARDRQGSTGISALRIEDSLGHASMPWPSHLSAEAKAFGPEWGRLAILLGNSLHRIPSQRTKEELLARFTIHPTFPLQFPEYTWRTFSASNGDLIFILATLLTLNLPKHVNITPQQPRPGIVKGRRVVFAAHNIVHIELGESRDIRRLFHNATGIKHRRHEVKGHFAHFHLRAGCSHDWPTVPEGREADEPRWRCNRCGGWRTWKKHHERGDAALGYVTKTYRVEK